MIDKNDKEYYQHSRSYLFCTKNELEIESNTTMNFVKYSMYQEWNLQTKNSSKGLHR